MRKYVIKPVLFYRGLGSWSWGTDFLIKKKWNENKHTSINSYWSTLDTTWKSNSLLAQIFSKPLHLMAYINIITVSKWWICTPNLSIQYSWSPSWFLFSYSLRFSPQKDKSLLFSSSSPKLQINPKMLRSDG